MKTITINILFYFLVIYIYTLVIIGYIEFLSKAFAFICRIKFFLDHVYSNVFCIYPNLSCFDLHFSIIVINENHGICPASCWTIFFWILWQILLFYLILLVILLQVFQKINYYFLVLSSYKKFSFYLFIGRIFIKVLL